MTNREWLESLSDKELSGIIATGCCGVCTMPHHNCKNGECMVGIMEWLQQEHKEPTKELTQAQLCEAFELKFGNRRAISLEEVRETAREIFK